MDLEQDPSVPKGKYVEYSLECEQDFDALPYSLGFEQVMNAHMTERTTVFESKTSIPLDISLLPHELSDTFYFPTKADLSNIQAVAKEWTDNTWTLFLKFSINSMVYVASSTEKSLLIQTDNSEGGSIDYSVNASVISKLLAAFAASASSTNRVKRQQALEGFTLPTDGSGIKKQLLALGHLIGETTSSTTAPLPYEYGDRRIIASHTETESMHASGVDTSIDLAWELFDDSTEFSYSSHSRREHTPEQTQDETSSIEVAMSNAAIDDYLLSKEFPELFEENKSRPTVTIKRSDPEWQRMAVTFMATVGPLMDKYKYLDTAD